MKTEREGLSPFNIRRFQAKLKTKWFGRSSYLFHSIDSTNRQAADFARRGVPEGTLVIAECQTHGKGRQGRTWFSPPFFNLTFSLVARLSGSEKNAPRMTFASCVALVEGIYEETGIQAQLKWPNDLLIQGKKTAGFLLEYIQRKNHDPFLVLGIGLNVNTPRELWPPEMVHQTHSLREILGEPLDRENLLAVLLSHLEKWYLHFLDGDWNKISSRWKEYSSSLGKKVQVVLENRKIKGVARDINSEGALLLDGEDGEKMTVYSGDVVHLREWEHEEEGIK